MAWLQGPFTGVQKLIPSYSQSGLKPWDPLGILWNVHHTVTVTVSRMLDVDHTGRSVRLPEMGDESIEPTDARPCFRWRRRPTGGMHLLPD